jgi:hypothetical protein
VGREVGFLYLSLVRLWCGRDGAFFEDCTCGRRIWVFLFPWLVLVKPPASAGMSSAGSCADEDEGSARRARDRPSLALLVVFLSPARLENVAHSAL